MHHYESADKAWCSVSDQEILDNLYAKPWPDHDDRSKDSGFPTKEFILFAIFVFVAYWPIARGIAWLLLAIGYWCGADGAVWPGPYTPYPPDMSL